MDKQRSTWLFYGWIIVFAGLWVTLVIFGIVNSFSVFFKPLAGEFGWDRGHTSLAYSLSWVSFGFLSIVAGRLVDRYGPRTVMFVGTLIFAVGILLLSRLNALWQLYVIFGVLLSIGKAANVIPLVATVLNWFVARRGLALAIAQSQGVGTVLISPMAAWLIALYGWRVSYLALGFLVLATALPLILFIQRRPADLKLQAYGDTGDGRELRGGILRVDWTLTRDAIGAITPSFPCGAERSTGTDPWIFSASPRTQVARTFNASSASRFSSNVNVCSRLRTRVQYAISASA